MTTPKRTKINNQDVNEDMEHKRVPVLRMPTVIEYKGVRVIDGREESRGDFSSCTQEIFDILIQPFCDIEWLEWMSECWQIRLNDRVANVYESWHHYTNRCIFVIEGERFYSAQLRQDSPFAPLLVQITPDITNHIWSGVIAHEFSHIKLFSEAIDYVMIAFGHMIENWSNVKCLNDIPFEIQREISHTRTFHDNFMESAKELEDLSLIGNEEYEAIVKYYSLVGPGKNTEILPQNLVMKNKM